MQIDQKTIQYSDKKIVDIQNQFIHALNLGTGQAMYLMNEHRHLDFSKPLIHAAMNNLANDPQSEGSRAHYIFKLIQRSRQKQFIVSQILRKFKNKKTDYWALDQLCDLAIYFYKEGISDARDIFLQRFDQNLYKEYEFCGEAQILRLEGVAGLLRLAEVCGKRHEGESNFADRWEIDEFQRKNKSIDVFDELKTAGKSNPYIQAYLDSLNAEEPIKRSRRAKVEAYTHADILRRINSPTRFSAFSEKLAGIMDQALVDTLAADFLKEGNPLKKSKYLKFFTVRKFPFDYSEILNIARKKIKGKSRLVPNAVGALAHFSGEDIRYLAIEKLSGEERPDVYILLLMNNFQTGDLDLLMNLIHRSDDFNYVHGLISGLLKLFRANPEIDCQTPLVAMYQRMNCGLHREDIVRLLHERKILPDGVLEELAFDSYDEVRKFYRQIKREKKSSSD